MWLWNLAGARKLVCMYKVCNSVMESKAICQIRITWYRASSSCNSFVLAYESLATKHRFTKAEPDWGFTKFCDTKKLPISEQASNLDSSAVQLEAVNITVYLRIVKDPTGVLWHNFLEFVPVQALDRNKEYRFLTSILAMIRRKRLGGSASRIKVQQPISILCYNVFIF